MPDPRLRYIHYDWLDAGERTQTTVRLLSEQLRRFLDDQVWLENRRVMELVRGIEAKRFASARRTASTTSVTKSMQARRRSRCPMERPLYTRATSAAVDSTGIENGDAQTDTTALFEQTYVDPAPLIRSVRKALQRTARSALAEVDREHPLRHGLAELVTYLSLDADGFSTVFDEASRDTIELDRPRRRHPGGHATAGDLRQRHGYRGGCPMSARTIARDQLSLPLAVTHLMKGVVYRDTHEAVWQHLARPGAQVSDYVATIGLVVVVDEAEGYAFLRSRPEDAGRRPRHRSRG